MSTIQYKVSGLATLVTDEVGRTDRGQLSVVPKRLVAVFLTLGVMSLLGSVAFPAPLKDSLWDLGINLTLLGAVVGGALLVLGLPPMAARLSGGGLFLSGTILCLILHPQWMARLSEEGSYPVFSPEGALARMERREAESRFDLALAAAMGLIILVGSFKGRSTPLRVEPRSSSAE